MAAPTPDPRSLRGAKRAEKAALGTLIVDLDTGRSILPLVYEGPVPDWPLPGVTVRELEVWGELWTRPQARVWADASMELEVAMYARTLCEAEQPSASTSLRSVALQQARALLLTPQTLKSAGYALSVVREVPRRSQRSALGGGQVFDVRDRWRPGGSEWQKQQATRQRLRPQLVEGDDDDD